MLNRCFTFAVLTFAFVLPAQSPARPDTTSLWREPHGRYTLTVPAGWHVEHSHGNLKLTEADSWAIFNTISGPATPLEAAQREAARMQAKVSDWKIYKQGPYVTSSRHPAAGVSVTCTVPTRTGPTHRVLLFLAQSAGNKNYVLMTSSVDAPTGKQANTIVSQTFDTVRFPNE